MDNSRGRKDLVAALVILVVTFAVFRMCPVHHLTDSRYQMMFSQQLLWNHSFSVEAKALPDLRPPKPGHPLTRGVDFSFRLEQAGGRFYYWFPPGSTILSVPFVALANAVGISAVDGNGVYDANGDQQIQANLAPLVMAGLSAVVFLSSRLILSFGWSVFITLATAFGTPIWSIASRTMWIHTWGIFLLAIAIWLVLRLDTQRGRPQPVLLATCLSWMYFVRPTFSISIIGIAVYLLIFHRAIFLRFAMTGIAWLAGFVAYSRYQFGELLPDYYRTQRYGFRFGPSFWEGLGGTLISPARGLLVYVPILLFLGYLIVRYRHFVRWPLTILASTVICAHVLVISGYTQWHGGWSYGPRYCTDVVPWFALVGILAVEARLRYRQANARSDSSWRAGIEWAVALVLLTWSITLHGIGATSVSAWYWNSLSKNPSDMNEFRARMWDWKHPQFLGAPR